LAGGVLYLPNSFPHALKIPNQPDVSLQTLGHHRDGDRFFDGVGQVFFSGGVADDGDVIGDEVPAVCGEIVAD
jgi:hypothetical protein